MPNRCRALLASLIASASLTFTAVSPGGTALAADAPAPAAAADAPADAVNASTDHLVMCWYMVCFGLNVEGYKQEIQLAQRQGIDGFLLDVGEWKNGPADNLKDSRYVEWTDNLYQAAKELGTGFRLAMAPEYSVQPAAANLRDMVLRYKDHPNQLRHDGKVVLSGYGGTGPYPGAVNLLKKDGVEVCVVPAVFFPRFAYKPTVETYQKEFANTPVLDGMMMFDAAELGTVISDNAIGRRATLPLNKIFAACVIPAYNSANLQDYRGLSGYLGMWQGAIEDGADWISIVIWNDYNEDSALNPGRWPAGAERNLYSRDESFLQATGYASAWFKSGTRPTITQDQMYVTYRNRSKWLRKGWDGQKWNDISFNPSRFDQIHDDVEDLVYVDTFLTAPATVTVRLGDTTTRLDMPAGVGHGELPMAVGVPHLTLERGGAVLADVVGRRSIIDTPNERNSLIGYHHVNRTWASGTAVGPVAAHLEAESGTLGTDATVVDIADGGKAVQSADVRGSGVTVPVSGLTTATYNIRIRYSNPGKEDARLTLTADGPVRQKGQYPYFIPAHFPPTGEGQFATTSFMWTLYDATTMLTLQWRIGEYFGQPNPADNDYGTVLIDAIELVKVEPFAMPATRETSYPELVAIPGGTYTMGSDTGEADERPRREVTLSAFAMGKYEVTNAEFEQFDPGHRAFRNGNSWRDREPVLHISWQDAAKYCNFLSARASLTPVYSEQAVDPAKPKEKSWVTDLSADGFRLPTEAEWEYVATGRGEGRLYPWGADAPIPGHHGRFQAANAGGVNLPRPATEESGVVVVGSYPAGASRDGVMDLAGNAGEWCSDWYTWYPEGAATNPIGATPSNFRSIRGGSWSWYGRSQRATDREFNSQNYPGHAYYGLRVVLPDAGYRKLTAAK